MSNNIRIQDIHNAAEARAEAQRRWAAKNDQGGGFPAEDHELAEQGIRLASRVFIARNETEVNVFITECGRELAIGEAHGAWGVWV